MVNRAATALRIGATTLLRSQSYLGAQYRRFRGKLGAPKAITVMAHKLARLVYRLLRWGHEYVDKGLQYFFYEAACQVRACWPAMTFSKRQTSSECTRSFSSGVCAEPVDPSASPSAHVLAGLT